MGETFQEWLKINQLDLIAICQSRRRQDKTACKSLSAIRDGKPDPYYTIDATNKRYRWEFVNGKLAEVSTGQALDFYAEGSHWSRSTAEEEITSLMQLYGPPTERKEVPSLSNFDTKFTFVEVTWNMPDGAVILGREFLQPDSPGSSRMFVVRFLSKEHVLRIKGRQKSNLRSISE